MRDGMRSMTLFAGSVERWISPIRLHHACVEPMLHGSVGMARLAIDGLNLLFVGNIVLVESDVAGCADELRVRGLLESILVNEEGEGLAVLLHRQRIVFVARKTVVVHLRGKVCGQEADGGGESDQQQEPEAIVHWSAGLMSVLRMNGKRFTKGKSCTNDDGEIWPELVEVWWNSLLK
jgi:hypothetical protein